MRARHLSAERRLRGLLGREHAEQIAWASQNLHAPVPVAGTPLLVVDGLVIPRVMGGALASLSDVIAEASAGKAQDIPFNMAGTLAVTGAWEDLWYLAGMPGVGATPSAVPGGSVPDRATAGALGQADAAGGDTLHLLGIEAVHGGAAAGSITLMLHDRLWHGALAMNTTGSQAISGAPTRNTDGEGNVMWIATRTVLPATAHTHTITYTDHAGNTGNSAGVATGISACAASRIDQTIPFIALASGDRGIREIDTYQCSAAVATGALDIVLARPLAMVPLVATGVAGLMDGLASLKQIPDGACLSFMTLRGTAVAVNYSGIVRAVSG